MTFAPMITASRRKIPYAIHMAMPSVNAPYIQSEMPSADRVRTILESCGMNEVVVRIAAINPIAVITIAGEPR